MTGVIPWTADWCSHFTVKNTWVWLPGSLWFLYFVPPCMCVFWRPVHGIFPALASIMYEAEKKMDEQMDS